MTTIVWFRQDLRLSDQAALAAASAEGPVIAVYVLDDARPGEWAIGGAARWWLHHSLAALDSGLRSRGSRLILRRGDTVREILKIAQQTRARGVHAIRHYEPWWVAAEAELGREIDLWRHDGNQLAPPDSIATGSGGRYRVYSAFWKALSAQMPPPAPQDAPEQIEAPQVWPESDRLEDWALPPTRPDWARGFAEDWTPGEAGAVCETVGLRRRGGGLWRAARPALGRGHVAALAASAFREISPAAVWHGIGRHGAFLRELAWRDFAAGVIADMPDYGARNGRPAFDRLRWRTGAAADADFRVWSRGMTGYPIVDAGMRQLWATGWMHNRVRMIAASFLVKHLLIDWRRGERWFWTRWSMPITATTASTGNGWRVPGIDSNMFGRIMAPLVQSPKFDAGDYIRQWVPELRDLGDDAVHDPEVAGCLPKGYPEKIVGHREGRERALAAAVRMRD